MFFNPGDTFGDYTVVRLLGKGGMGEVWLMEGASGAWVAAKILDLSSASDHESRRRFLREAQLALGVKHPNLVEVYDVGEDPETGYCYILMEYVQGGTLADRLAARGALPIDEAVALVRAMASVLKLAHGKNIVHRDIKPANIMFAADGTPKLADLGIARSGGTPGMTTVTRTGVMIGTPAYMAPEQMLDAHGVDTRADIYSLGVVFYEMLAGERPNKDDTIIQLMTKAVTGEPLPDVRTLRPEVSAAIAQLLNMMVAPDRDSRIATPEQLMDTLVRAENTGAGAAKVRGDTRKKRRAVWILSAAIIVGLAMAAVAFFSSVSRPKQPAVEPVRPVPKAESVDSKPIPVQPVQVAQPVQAKPPEQVVLQVQAKPPTQVVTHVQTKPPVSQDAWKNGEGVVIGCDISPHGDWVFWGSSHQPCVREVFGAKSRVLPLQFKLTPSVLSKINLLVMPRGSFFDMDDSERRAVDTFLRNGGVVLALIYSKMDQAGESLAPASKWLKTYGATVYYAAKDAYGKVVAAEPFRKGEPQFTFQYGSTYECCDSRWMPVLVYEGDQKKIVSAFSCVGKGRIVFMPQCLACNSKGYFQWTGDYPWREVLLSHLNAPQSPDPSFVGSTLADAPRKAETSRTHFYSSVVDEKYLIRLSELTASVETEYARLFGADILTFFGATNCIVGQSGNGKSEAFDRRLSELGGFSFAATSPTVENDHISETDWKVRDYLVDMLVAPVPQNDRRDPVAMSRKQFASFMAATVWDEIWERDRGKSLGAFINNGRRGARAQIKRAQKRDQDFTKYDDSGNPKAGKVPKLDPSERDDYCIGRRFAMLNDLWRAKPDLFQRCFKIIKKQSQTGLRQTCVSPAECATAILCEAYGSDWPKRWPGSERSGNSTGAKPKAESAKEGSPEPVDTNVEWGTLPSVMTKDELVTRLANTKIRAISFKSGESVFDAMEVLRKELGLNFAMRFEAAQGSTTAVPKLQPLSVNDMPASEALNLVCESMGCAYEIHHNIVVIFPKRKDSGKAVRLEWMPVARDRAAKVLCSTRLPQLVVRPPMTMIDLFDKLVLPTRSDANRDRWVNWALKTEPGSRLPALPPMIFREASIWDILEIACRNSAMEMIFNDRSVLVRPIAVKDGYEQTRDGRIVKRSRFTANQIKLMYSLDGWSAMRKAVDMMFPDWRLSDNLKSQLPKNIRTTKNHGLGYRSDATWGDTLTTCGQGNVLETRELRSIAKGKMLHFQVKAPSGTKIGLKGRGSERIVCECNGRDMQDVAVDLSEFAGSTMRLVLTVERPVFGAGSEATASVTWANLELK